MTSGEPTIQDVLDRLGHRKVDALTTLELLQQHRARVTAEAARLENPQAVLEYIDFFVGEIEQVLVEVDRLSIELPQRVQRAHVELLRHVASACRTEQRRCLVFRDKCINRPLPHEDMRPLLNDISVTTRDQLTAFYDFNSLAAWLEGILAATPEPEPARGLGRRQLFTRLFKPPK